MDNRDIELYTWIMREQQQRLLREIEQQALLNDGQAPNPGLKRRVLLSLAITVVIVTIAIFTGAQFFV